MTRSKVRRQIVAALSTMLPPDEGIVAAGRAWLADRRPRVPLVFTGRAFYLVAVTDRRLVVFDRPRRGRPVLEADLRFARRFDAMELRSVRRWSPLLQVRLGIPADEREIVVELRRRDRPVGEALASLTAPGGEAQQTPATGTAPPAPRAETAGWPSAPDASPAGNAAGEPPAPVGPERVTHPDGGR